MRQRLWLLPLSAALITVAACGGDPPQSPTPSEPAETIESPTASAPEPADQTVPPAADSAAEAASADLPEGVTADMVDAGRAVFSGPGICATCHGPSATGVPGLGSDLTDGVWEHSDGSFEGLVTTVTEGVSAQASSTGVPMIPRGGTSISDEQVRAVAAYLWTLNR